MMLSVLHKLLQDHFWNASIVQEAWIRGEETKVYSNSEINTALIEYTIKEVVQILEERGYDAKNQIIGYLISGDPGYISSHKEARNKITKFDRIELLEVIVDKFLKCDI